MTWTRRHMLQLGGAAFAAASLPSLAESEDPKRDVIKPNRLKENDLVGLINPASATFFPDRAEITREALATLGLRTRFGDHLFDRFGYFAGRDEDRAADINTFFADPEVKAVLAQGGGWGCNRLLPLLDYDLIRSNPKIVMGMSDITGLLLGIQARTGLVTFHGPTGSSSWTEFTTDQAKRVLFDGEALTMRNKVGTDDRLVQVANRVLTITPGKARGRLLGGNLTVLTAMVGSGYLPDFGGSILFLEDVNEEVYRVDRMLTQLGLAGVLKNIEGFVFGHCRDCEPDGRYGSLTLPEVLNDHIAPLGVPAWYGSMIGHIADKFTVPLGIEAEIDSNEGTIRLLETAVA
jgi:muramoyltetrapeptide carboxypeptidase